MKMEGLRPLTTFRRTKSRGVIDALKDFGPGLTDFRPGRLRWGSYVLVVRSCRWDWISGLQGSQKIRKER